MPVAADTAGVTASKEGELQLLVFTLHGEEFAFNLTDAREIMKLMPLTEVPSAPAAVRGILNLRGKVVTVLDLATLLGFSPTEEAKEHIVIVDATKEIFGILVHQVTGVLRVPASTLKTTPNFLESKAQAAHVRGALVLDKQKKMNDAETVADAATSGEGTRLILALDLPALLAGLHLHS